jgi:GntR family transcriptional regulator
MRGHSLIDYTSNIPYYIQLIDSIREKIQTQIYLPGNQIPGEQDLCETYGISRTVVRQALKELEVEGLIFRRKGKGTFVSEPKISEGLVQKLTGFYQDMVEKGLKPGTKVLRQARIPANDKVARYLQILPGTEVVILQRIRYINDEPIQLVTSYIPYRICPELVGQDLSDRSLYDYLEKDCGIVLSRARRQIEAVAANEQEANLLDIDRDVPLLMLDSVSFLDDGTPVEYYHALHRGDRSRFEVELIRKMNEDGSASEVGANFLNIHNTP